MKFLKSIALLLVGFGCLAQTNPKKERVVLQQGERVLIEAMRGVPKEGPENTLLGIRHATMMGADRIGMDVRLTKDRIPVLMKDETLDRTTNGSGPLSEVNLKELEKLDAGSAQLRSNKQVSVPTLKEVLQLVGPKKVPVHLYIHESDAVMPALDLLREFGMEAHATLSGDIDGFMNKINSEFPLVQTLLRSDDSTAILWKYGKEEEALERLIMWGRKGNYNGLYVHEYLLSAETVFRIKANGLQIHVAGVREVTGMERFKAWMVDGIATENGKQMTQVFQHAQEAKIMMERTKEAYLKGELDLKPVEAKPPTDKDAPVNADDQ